MSIDKQKSIEAMRTFSRDLERERKARGIPEDPKAKPDQKGVGSETDKEKEVPQKKHKTNEVPKLKAQKGPDIKATPKTEGESTIVKKSKKENKSENKDKRSPEPKRIPAFHELQKVVETNIKADEDKKETPKAKAVKGIEPTKKVGGGTVITDTKNNRRPLFSQISKSFKKWLEDIKKSLKRKNKNAYEVSQTNRRKGVVQKATTKTGAIFSADNDTLKEQIKARQRAEKHEDDEGLNWSPYTEPGYPLLEGEEAESVDPRVNKVSVVKKTHAQPKPVIKATEKIPELQEKKEEATLEALVEEAGVEIPTEPPEETASIPEEAAPEEEETEETKEVEEELEEITTMESIANFLERIRSLSLKDTNTLAMLLVGIALAIIIFGIVLFRIFDVDDSGSMTPVVPERAIYSGAALDIIPLENRSMNEILTQTNSALLENNSGTKEYRYARGDGKVLSSDVVMHLIQAEPTDGFANAVTAVRLVETSNSHRALILTTTDTATALGGMISWEPNLLSDLGILLNLPSVPPNAGAFADRQFGSLDVRALMFDDSPLLVYAIINESDVIITNDMSVLTPYMEN